MGFFKDIIKAGVYGSVASGVVNSAIATAKTKATSMPTKCPKNSKVEVIWREGVDGWGNPVFKCSFSGRQECKKCINKGEYPK